MCDIHELDSAQTCPRSGNIEVRTVGSNLPVKLCLDCFVNRYGARPDGVRRITQEKIDG